jgi:hypothetical protein
VVAQTQQPPPISERREKSGSDIRRRRVGRAIELALFQSPLWTSADNNAGSVPNAEFAEKDGNRQFWLACEGPGAQILSSLESTDVILGCKPC